MQQVDFHDHLEWRPVAERLFREVQSPLPSRQLKRSTCRLLAKQMKLEAKKHARREARLEKMSSRRVKNLEEAFKKLGPAIFAAAGFDAVSAANSY